MTICGPFHGTLQTGITQIILLLILHVCLCKKHFWLTLNKLQLFSVEYQLKSKRKTNSSWKTFQHRLVTIYALNRRSLLRFVVTLVWFWPSLSDTDASPHGSTLAPPPCCSCTYILRTQKQDSVQTFLHPSPHLPYLSIILIKCERQTEALRERETRERERGQHAKYKTESDKRDREMLNHFNDKLCDFLSLIPSFSVDPVEIISGEGHSATVWQNTNFFFLYGKSLNGMISIKLCRYPLM